MIFSLLIFLEFEKVRRKIFRKIVRLPSWIRFEQTKKKTITLTLELNKRKQVKTKSKVPWESKNELFTLLRHTCTFTSTAGFYPDLKIKTRIRVFLSSRLYFSSNFIGQRRGTGTLLVSRLQWCECGPHFLARVLLVRLRGLPISQNNPRARPGLASQVSLILNSALSAKIQPCPILSTRFQRTKTGVQWNN